MIPLFHLLVDPQILMSMLSCFLFFIQKSFIIKLGRLKFESFLNFIHVSSNIIYPIYKTIRIFCNRRKGMIQYLYMYIILYFIISTTMAHVDLLLFQANLIDAFSTWHNPLELAESKIKDEDKITIWRTTPISERQWREHARIAWDISPVLAVYLPAR